MDASDILGLIATVAAVSGVLLNNKHRIACFYVWLVSNAISGGLHIAAGLFSLALRDAIFFVLCLHGIRCWSRDHNTGARL